MKCTVYNCDFNKNGECLVDQQRVIEAVDENGNILSCNMNTVVFNEDFLHSLNNDTEEGGGACV